MLAPLYRVAYRLTGQHADAEDLVQDTIVKAFHAFDRCRFTGEGELRAWMFTILSNTFRDGYRRRIRSPEVSYTALASDPDSNVIELVPCSEPGPAQQYESKLFWESAQAVIERLPPDVRLAVTLYFVEGYTYQEIAEISNAPIGTVMSRLWRGRRILREQLARFADERARDVAGSTRGDGTRRRNGDA